MIIVLWVVVFILLLVEAWNLFRIHILMGYVEELADRLRRLDEDLRG
jgi:hypothetical protein